jgi:hypothetical protein
LLLLVCVELGARLAIITAAPGLRGELAWAEAQTHADLAALQGHAFLQFVGGRARRCTATERTATSSASSAAISRSRSRWTWSAWRASAARRRRAVIRR